jgi:Gly-Xaa carboxypeptidase
MGGIHTVNEKASVNDHLATVKWFVQFIRNMDEAALP